MKSTNPIRRRRAVLRAAQLNIEGLERRRLLSTINWTNKGTGSGAGDTDDFNAIYGSNATVARNITQRAIDDWERVIVDFNYPGGGNTYSLQVFGTAFSGGLRGQTDWPATNANEQPTSTRIQMDDNGGGSGWWFDPDIGNATVPDDAEFTSLVTPFAADNVGTMVGRDFYRTMIHEIGHAMGILRRGNGDYAIESFMAFAGTDPLDGSESLYTVNFGGGAAEYTMTTSGGGHLFEGGGTYSGPTHPNEGMNAGRAIPQTRRNLISDTAAELLRDAYGYTIRLPSTLNTFYANLDTVTNTVTVQGDAGTAVDNIDLEVDGTAMSFEVNGTDEVIEGAQFTVINVNGNGGNDDIDVDELLSGKTVSVNGGDGNDNISVAQELGDIDTNLLSNVTLNGGAGTDTVVLNDFGDGVGSDIYTISEANIIKGATRTVAYSSIDRLTITGSPSASTYTISSTWSTTDYVLTGGAGSDDFIFGTGLGFTTTDANVTVNGGGGVDSITVDDSSESLSRNYSGGSTSLSRSSSTGFINWSSIEDITLNAGTAGDTGQFGGVLSSATLRINGNNGGDLFEFGTDLDTNFLGSLIVNGGLGTDSITFDDVADTLDDNYNINTSAGTFTKSSMSNTLNFFGFEDVTLEASDANNNINIERNSSGISLTVDGNAGNDSFVNTIQDINTNFTGPVTIVGGLGSDSLTLTDTGDLSATAYTLTNNSFQVTGGILSSVLTYGSLESFNFTASDEPTLINVNSASAAVDYVINAGDGNDTIDFGNGDFDSNISSIVTVVGGAGVDRVRIDDTTDTLADTYTISGGSFAKPSSIGGVNWAGFLIGTVNIEQFVLDANADNNTINLNSLGGRTFLLPPNPPIENPVAATINAGSGNDTIVIGGTNGVIESLVGSVVINGEIGVDTVRANDINDAGTDTYTVGNDSLSKTGHPYNYTFETTETFILDANNSANNISVSTGLADTINWVINASQGADSIVMSSGPETTTLNGGDGADTIRVDGNASGTFVTVDGGPQLDAVVVNSDAAGLAGVAFAVDQDLFDLTLAAGGRARLNAGDRLVTVGTLNISNASNTFLDITDGTVVNTYSGGSPAATIRSRITTGRNGGLWNGPGIRTSLGTENFGIGHAETADLSVTFPFNFAGLALDNTTHIIRYTRNGDTNLDRTVGFIDLVNLSRNYNQSPRSWVNGDLDYNNAVDFLDLVTLARNYNLPFSSVAIEASGTARADTSARSVLSSRSDDVIW